MTTKLAEIALRIECVKRCNKEILELIESGLTNYQHELILRIIYDIDIALDMNDTEAIENNWYGLFKNNNYENII